MANKIHFSPVRSILAHWQKMIMAKSPIDITPLVTRVARYVKAMEGAEVTFLPETEAYIYEVSLEHFVQRYMMQEGPGNSIFMCYPGYDREIELPCLKLSLYSVKSLTLQMEKREPARRSVVGPQMRSSTRREQAGAGPSRRTPPVHASTQPGPSTQNMSFEEAYGHYTYDPYQASDSGYAGGQEQVCIHLMVHRCVPHRQHASTSRTRFSEASLIYQTASPPLARSSSKYRI